MTVTAHNGGFIISAIVRNKGASDSGYRDKMYFLYYTEKQAIAKYKKYLRLNRLEEVE